MGHWTIDDTSEPGILMMCIEGTMQVEETENAVRAHNKAVEAFGVSPYRVFVDLRKMAPLSPEAAEVLEKAKKFSAGRRNFQGSAVLVASQVVAMQHRRTSTTGGVIGSELISDDEFACRAHLRDISRRKLPPEANR